MQPKKNAAHPGVEPRTHRAYSRCDHLRHRAISRHRETPGFAAPDHSGCALIGRFDSYDNWLGSGFVLQTSFFRENYDSHLWCAAGCIVPYCPPRTDINIVIELAMSWSCTCRTLQGH